MTCLLLITFLLCNLKFSRCLQDSGHGPSKTLRKIIKELDEKDYDHFSSWGNLKEANRTKEEETEKLSSTMNIDKDSQSILIPTILNQMVVETKVNAERYRQETFSIMMSRFQIVLHNMMNFKSLIKISFLLFTTCVISFLSVSPRNLPPNIYNQQFLKIFSRLLSSFVAPTLLLIFLSTDDRVNANQVVDSVTSSYFFGFSLLCTLQLGLSTVIRMGIIRILEPEVFELSPLVPTIFLPWTTENYEIELSKNTKKWIFFVSDCLMAPFLEEWYKSSSVKKAIEKDVKLRRKIVLEQNVSTHFWNPPVGISTNPGFSVEPSSLYNPTHYYPNPIVTENDFSARSNRFSSFSEKVEKEKNQEYFQNQIETSWKTPKTFLVYGIGSAIGLKIADNTRRIIQYLTRGTKNNLWDSVILGINPLHELCTSIAVLGLADQQILSTRGNNRYYEGLIPFLISVLLHGFANYCGKKPLYMWKKWDEMVLRNGKFDSNPEDLVKFGFISVLWVSLIFKGFFYVSRRFVQIKRDFIQKEAIPA